MKHNILFLTITFLLTFLHSSKTTKELLDTISNTKPKLDYFFFIEKNRAFLVKEIDTDNKTYKVWHYTQTRKWQPISNATEYDGFELALNHFNNISINKAEKTISFGNIINYNNELPYNLSSKENNTSDILPLLQTIQNKTVSIGWYFWNESNESFLFKEDNKKGIKIWNYTEERKWKPLYNTDEFDGFEKASDTLKDVKFTTNPDNDKFSISIGDVNTKTDKDSFILTIKTDIKGISTDTQYSIFTDSNYTYDYSVDCDSDGILEAENLDGDYICKYDKKGVYDVSIKGIYPSRADNKKKPSAGPFAYNSDENKKILDIKQWGNIKWKNMQKAFAEAQNMTMSATDKPNLAEVKNMSRMFDRARKFNSDISNWDVSSVMDMSYMFKFAFDFNKSLNDWDVSSVTNMHSMFFRAQKFNSYISNWDVSSVTNMEYMFNSAYSFNQDISKWNVSSVLDMTSMFGRTRNFNQDISKWNVSSVTTMTAMFSYTESFNQNINDWDVSNVKNMGYMFKNSKVFNQNINDWDVSNVISMKNMFENTISFNGNVSNWDVSKVDDLSNMFYNAKVFNQDIGNWDVSNALYLYAMFSKTEVFNQDLTRWEIQPKAYTNKMFLDAKSMEEKNKPTIYLI